VETPFALAIYPQYSLHPTLAANRANLMLAPLLYEPLFQVDSGFQAVPVLCQSYTASGDKLIWDFVLRTGVTFSDGTPLTGTAVAAALNLARQSGSRYAQRLSHVTAVIGSESQVTITLDRPNSSLPLLLDIPIALDDGDRPAGTGPYVLTEGEGGLSLTARTGWWQNLTLPAQQITLTSVTKSDELILAFGAGNVSLVDVDLMGTNALGYSGNYETWDYATTDLLYLGFNTQKGVCRSAQVRKALALAADRASIAQTTYASHAVAATLPVHPDSGLYDETLAQDLAYAPAGLADRLEELNVSGRTLTLLVNSENTAKVSAAQMIAYQLEAVGMEVELKQLTFEDYTAALKAGNFDLYLGEVVLTADFDLTPLLAENGALNYGGWSSGEISGLLSNFAASDGQTRRLAASELFLHLNQEVPIAPLCFKNGSVLTQWGRLSGLSPVRNDVFFQLENWSLHSAS
jgi:peptide/nickel transport system substrate-binding protein